MKNVFHMICILLAIVNCAWANVWTGSTSEPQEIKTIDGREFYVITNAEELAWFAAKVNGGDVDVSAILGNDIFLLQMKLARVLLHGPR
ncbi:MAG: hypothetical protein MJZ25_12380 [Fibrobacter sp.]|nr:hypothetical protein [Fibrobacter sp.]